MQSQIDQAGRVDGRSRFRGRSSMIKAQGERWCATVEAPVTKAIELRSGTKSKRMLKANLKLDKESHERAARR